MKTIVIPRRIEDYDAILHWETTWDSERNVDLVLPRDLNKKEIEHLFEVFFPRSSSLAASVLAELAEMKAAPWSMLEKYFRRNDPSLLIPICLRKDIPKTLLKKCLASSSLDLLEHAIFNPKVSIAEVQTLLRNLIMRMKSTAGRAIVHKKHPGIEKKKSRATRAKKARTEHKL